MYYMGVQVPKGKGQFLGLSGYSKALVIFATRSRQRRCKRDHSIANNVMQQKGSFSMPGRRKYYFENALYGPYTAVRISLQGTDLA